MLIKVTINSIDVTSKVASLEYERTFGDLLNEVTIKFFRGINDLLTLTNGQTLVVQRGWTLSTEETVLSGYVEKFEPDGGLITVTGIDKLWDLVRKEVNYVYDSSVHASAGKISEIFKDLVTTYGGLTADATTVQDSGTTLTLSKFVCNHSDIFERCKKLADMLDWQFYYNSDDDKVYFEPKGFTSNSTILTVGGNVISIPKWQNDITEMVNDLTVIGAYQEVETTESGEISVTAGYTTTGITISYIPISVKVYGDANNPPTTLKVGGMPESTATYDYYVDKNQKKVLPKAGTSFTANDHYEIRYSLAAPIPINMYSQESIDTYGKFTKTITFNDIRSVADAEQRGTNYLAKYSVPFIYTTLKVKNSSTTGLDIGQKIRVIDSISKPNIDQWLIINKLRVRYPTDYDEIDVGDKYWRLADFQSTVMEKFKRIEEEQIDNQEIINNLITVDNRSISPIVVKRRYQKVMYNTATRPHCFILGNADHGVLGTDELGDTGISADTDSFIMQYENIYTENFYDTDFKGTTTADWDTTNKWLAFDAGELSTSTSIDYNNSTITTVTLTATVSSGTFKYEVTADGGAHWETATNGAAHTFTDTGTDLRWRITENGASTGKISKIEITAYH